MPTHTMTGVLGLDRSTLERARLSRDPRFDGTCFIAVTSTGVYCRPICAARTPHPRHVRYYPTAAAAAHAGFRPCLRCRPEAAPGGPAWIARSAVLRRALRLIDGGALDAGSVTALAAAVGLEPARLRRLFVRHLGAPPAAVGQTRRLHFAKRLLDDTALPLPAIALASGFGSERRCSAVLRATYGRPLRELRRRPALDERGGGDTFVLELAARPPFEWARLNAFFAARAIDGVERVDAGSYTRTVTLGRGTGHAEVAVQPVEGRAALTLRVRGAPPAALFELSATARRCFDLAGDPACIASAFERDPLLGPLVARRPGLRLAGVWDPFECAVRAVLGQQVSLAAARTFGARLVRRAGRRIAADDAGLTHLFPDAAALATIDLGGLGLTRARAEALQRLGRAVVEGALDFAAPVEQVMAAMASLRGLGPWTAEYVALRGLGEADAFPAEDLVLRRAAGEPGRSPARAAALRRRAEAWRPWRGYAAIHLWSADA